MWSNKPQVCISWLCRRLVYEWSVSLAWVACSEISLRNIWIQDLGFLEGQVELRGRKNRGAGWSMGNACLFPENLSFLGLEMGICNYFVHSPSEYFLCANTSRCRPAVRLPCSRLTGSIKGAGVPAEEGTEHGSGGEVHHPTVLRSISVNLLVNSTSAGLGIGLANSDRLGLGIGIDWA